MRTIVMATESRPWKKCWCKELLEAFGSATLCGTCGRLARVRELEAKDYVPINRGYRRAYQDCNVPLESVISDGTWWVPRWAERIVVVMHDTDASSALAGYCGPMLQRAVEDEEFRAACEAIMRLSGESPDVFSQRIDERDRLVVLAKGVGLQPLTSATLAR